MNIDLCGRVHDLPYVKRTPLDHGTSVLCHGFNIRPNLKTFTGTERHIDACGDTFDGMTSIYTCTRSRSSPDLATVLGFQLRAGTNTLLFHISYWSLNAKASVSLAFPGVKFSALDYYVETPKRRRCRHINDV